MNAGRLSGKVAIVTGTAGGIGQEVAFAFAREGAAVVGCDFNAAGAAATQETARAAGLPFDSVHPCDLTREDDVQRLIEHTMARHGRIDILVNAAATAVFAWIEEMSYADWRKTIAGELDVVFLACRAAWPHLKKSSNAAIINFASANAHGALAGSGALAHCAGKGGVLAMTRQLAMEGGPHGIRANTISPALVVTPATAPVVASPKMREHVLSRKMIKRLGQPADIAHCAIYLASDEASWVTGADFSVDGGATAW